jgi:hypothetical protein
MENKKKPLHNDADHKLRSRRDFLSQGLMASAASMLLPFNAFGQTECEVASMVAIDNPMIPVIVVDLAGGANIGGSNALVGNTNGQMHFLPNYQSLGLMSSEHPSNVGMISDLRGNTTTPSGLLFHSRSGMLAGIRAAAGTAVNNTDGIVMCGISGDDTENNPHNPMYWFFNAGARGQLTQLVGTRANTSGGNSQAPVTSIDLSIAPLRVTRPSDVTDLASLGPMSRNNNFAQGRENMLLRALEGLSSSKVRALSRRGLPDAVKDLVLCNITKTQGLLNRFSSNQLDPLLDNDVRAVFPDIANNGGQQEAGSVAKMVLDGYAACGTITLGGYDYHGNDRAETDTRDTAAGTLIGRILNLAQRKNTKVVVYVISDGGVSANGTDIGTNGRFSWSSDSGNRGSSLMLVYDPMARPVMRSNSRQMGNFQTSGSIQPDASPMSNSVTTLAKAVMLNYLALHGREGELAAVVGDNPFLTDLNRHLLFGRIV